MKSMLGKYSKYLPLAAVILLLILPLVVHNQYVLHVLVLIGVYAILAQSLNLIMGYAGQLALGHAAFWALGAYTSALLLLHTNVSFWIALLAGGLVSYGFGAVLAFCSLRLKDDYLGLVALGFGEIVRIVATQLEITRGPMGLPGIPAPSIFGFELKSETAKFYLVIVLCVITQITLTRLIKSRFGRSLQAIRDDELAARVMGVESFRYKVLAFATSSFYAGIAGAFYASWIGYISPDSFQFLDSSMFCAMITLGGLGTLWGGVLGAGILGALPELFRSVAEYRFVIVGLVMVVMILLKPEGILGVPTARSIQIRRNVTQFFEKLGRKGKMQKKEADR